MCSNRIAVRIETVDDAVLSLIEPVCLDGDLCEKGRTGEADGYEITGAATAAEIVRRKTCVEVASPTGFEPVFWP